jgi:hypothetical protein
MEKPARDENSSILDPSVKSFKTTAPRASNLAGVFAPALREENLLDICNQYLKYF